MNIFYFYPAPLRGGRREILASMQASKKFLSTPSARRATNSRTNGQTHVDISIHALCEEGDRSPRFRLHKPTDFYPRPLRGGRPHSPASLSTVLSFLSTPSARRATGCAGAHDHLEVYFYPRPLRGGRQEATIAECRIFLISIHALCEEGDWSALADAAHKAQFLSTPSARRATPQPRLC